jgi:hypothetical protein
MTSTTLSKGVNAFARKQYQFRNPWHTPTALNRRSFNSRFLRCSFDDPLPEPPLPREPVPDRIFPTPTDVPVPEPFDVPAPSPVDVPVQTPQDIPAPPSEWPDDPALTLRASRSLSGVFTP